MQVKEWEGWVRVDSVLEQEGISYTKEQTDRFIIEVLIDDQDKYTTSSKWYGESDEGSLWDQSDYYHQLVQSNSSTIWESIGTGIGFGQVTLEIDEEIGCYKIMVGASLEKLLKTTRNVQGSITYESELYEHERFAGLWTGWVDLPKSGMVLRGEIKNINDDENENISWELWPKGKAPKDN